MNKRPIREIASEESDDEELNNKIIAKIMARKNAEKICDHFAFQESSDSEVDTVAKFNKSLKQDNLEAGGDSKGNYKKKKQTEQVFLASTIGRSKQKPLSSRVKPNVASKPLPQSQPKEPLHKKVKAVCSDEFKPVLKPEKGAKDPPRPARAALVVQTKSTDKVKRDSGRPKLPQRSGRPRKVQINKEYENSVHLELLEAPQDNLNTSAYTDSVDPFDDPEQQLGTDFEMDPPFEWEFGDCHSKVIPKIEMHQFNPPQKPGPTIPGLKHMSAAEVMECFWPNSLYELIAVETNAYFERCQLLGKGDEDDIEERKFSQFQFMTLIGQHQPLVKSCKGSAHC